MMPHKDTRTAPAYQVPRTPLLSIEHPFEIEDIDNCVETLGGDSNISKLLLDGSNHGEPANLYLRPEDAFSKPVFSTPISTQNVLLKITAPRRTGRKRKRGSNDPFTEDPRVRNSHDHNTSSTRSDEHVKVQRIDSSHILRSLQDNVDKVQVEAVGSVNLTHRWRGIPDFVYSTGRSIIASEFRRSILPNDFIKLKSFDVSKAVSPDRPGDIMPPPAMSNQNLPFIYGFRQNPAMKVAVNPDGSMEAVNTQAPVLKTLATLVPGDSPTVPTDMPSSLPPLSSKDARFRRLVSQLRSLMSDRPVWTRRSLQNSLPQQNYQFLIKSAIPYVGYIFKSGPYRDSVVRYGIDPRSAPEYRQYQTVIFKFDRTTNSRTIAEEPATTANASNGPSFIANRKWTRVPSMKRNKADLRSHIFDGQTVSTEGRTWAFCDITDPLLRKILSTPEIRQTFDVLNDGWFHNGTLAKMKIIMRSKIRKILDNEKYSDTEFERVLAMPERTGGVWDGSGAFSPVNATEEEESDWAAANIKVQSMRPPLAKRTKLIVAGDEGQDSSRGGGENANLHDQEQYRGLDDEDEDGVNDLVEEEGDDVDDLEGDDGTEEDDEDSESCESEDDSYGNSPTVMVGEEEEEDDDDEDDDDDDDELMADGDDDSDQAQEIDT